MSLGLHRHALMRGEEFSLKLRSSHRSLMPCQNPRGRLRSGALPSTPSCDLEDVKKNSPLEPNTIRGLSSNFSFSPPPLLRRGRVVMVEGALAGHAMIMEIIFPPCITSAGVWYFAPPPQYTRWRSPIYVPFSSVDSGGEPSVGTESCRLMRQNYHSPFPPFQFVTWKSFFVRGCKSALSIRNPFLPPSRFCFPPLRA